jgi:membrane protease subunit HflK
MNNVEMRSDLNRVFRHARTVAKGLILLLILLYLSSGFYSVKPEQRGVLKRFGRVVTDNMPPGIHYHLPWPAESVVRLKTTEIRTMPVRFEEVKVPEKVEVVEGTQEEKVVEGTQQVKPVKYPQVETSAPLLTADENLVLGTLLVQYTISEPKSYLYTSNDADGILKRIVQQATITKVVRMSVEDVFTTGRLKMQTMLKEKIQERIDAYDLGIRIGSIQIDRIKPPKDVARAFRDVASAREDRQKIIQQARGSSNQRLPRARADANNMKTKAEAYAKEVVDRARGDAERFTSAWNEYRKAKDVTGHRLYMEAMEEILRKVTKLISNPKAEQHIPAPKTHYSQDLAPPSEEPVR